jgi:hypothetical protein
MARQSWVKGNAQTRKYRNIRTPSASERGVRDTSGGWLSTPIGVKECSHGWSNVRREADIAEPVVGKHSSRSRPERAEDRFHPLTPPPRRGGTILFFPIPRVPLRYTRGYIPTPLRGGKTTPPKLSRTRMDF